MNTNPHDPLAREFLSGSAEETLRLIANLPAPQGLEDRVERAVLRSEPSRGRAFAWTAFFRPDRPLRQPWLRATAAAAIAFVVVGGGWGVYYRAERQQAEKVIATPARGPETGGFSNAGAIRTPQTLNKPVLAQPADASSAANRPADATGKRSIKPAGKKRRPAPAAKARNSAAATVAPAK